MGCFSNCGHELTPMWCESILFINEFFVFSFGTSGKTCLIMVAMILDFYWQQWRFLDHTKHWTLKSLFPPETKKLFKIVQYKVKDYKKQGNIWTHSDMHSMHSFPCFAFLLLSTVECEISSNFLSTDTKDHT